MRSYASVFVHYINSEVMTVIVRSGLNIIASIVILRSPLREPKTAVRESTVLTLIGTALSYGSGDTPTPCIPRSFMIAVD